MWRRRISGIDSAAEKPDFAAGVGKPPGKKIDKRFTALYTIIL